MKTKYRPYDPTVDVFDVDSLAIELKTDCLTRAQLNAVFDVLDDVVLDCCGIELLYTGKLYGRDTRYRVYLTLEALLDDYDSYDIEDGAGIDNMNAAFARIHSVAPLSMRTIEDKQQALADGARI